MLQGGVDVTTPPPGRDLEGFKSRLREALLEEHRRQRATTDQAPALATKGPAAGIRRASPSRRRLKLAAVMASLLAAALLASLLPRGAGSPPVAAAAALDSVARVAAAQPGRALRPGQFWYTKTLTVQLQHSYRFDPRPRPPTAPSPWFRGVSRETEEIWVGLDAHGDIQTYRRWRVPRETIYEQDRAAWTAAGEPALTGPTWGEGKDTLLLPIPTFTAGFPISAPMIIAASDLWELYAKAPPVPRWGRVDPNSPRERAFERMIWDRLVRRIQTLPASPGALEKLLRERIASARRDGIPRRETLRDGTATVIPDRSDCRCSTNEQLFQMAAELLQEPMTTPAVRAALYRMVAGLDGIDLFGSAADELGRYGTAVGMTFRGMRHELLFDPRSSRLLETRTVLVAQPPETWMNGLRYGTVLTSTLYLESRVVGSIKATR
jgi:hypothetical protein